MMARLVAMDVAAHQAVLGDVLISSVGIFREVLAEQFVQILQKLLLSAHERHRAVHVLWGVEAEIQ